MYTRTLVMYEMEVTLKFPIQSFPSSVKPQHTVDWNTSRLPELVFSATASQAHVVFFASNIQKGKRFSEKLILDN